jgi:putative salt-induced outer membrane protein YdiY
MSKQCLGPILATFLLLGLFPLSAVAEKTDVVILINGNAVTGEVKSLEFGLLKYSTDSMGTVSIDWEDIVSVSSKQNLQIELTDGTKYFGEIMPTADPHVVRVVTVSNEYEFKSAQIVRITPIETSDKFLQRLDGSFSFGIQTQKASDVTTSNLTADVNYRARTYLVGLRINSAITDQPDPEAEGSVTTARQSITTNYQRFRKNRWFTDWFTGWEQNDEQGIKGRSSLGGAMGRYILQTNKNQFSTTVGLQASHTKFFDDEEGNPQESTNTAEGRIEIRYLRRNLVPESSFRITYTLYPLLEDLSEYRAESDMSLRREVYDDLFLELSVGYSYISYPPDGASTTDYTATTSIGYSF